VTTILPLQDALNSFHYNSREVFFFTPMTRYVRFTIRETKFRQHNYCLFYF